MPVYSYQAIDKSGRCLSGAMPAADELSLEKKLKDTGLWLTEAQVRFQKTAADSGSVQASRVRHFKLRGGRGRRELIEFCTLMTFQVKAGVTIVRALDVA